MCGIFGYVGEKNAVPLIIEGLRKLEYRGYDSAGLVTLNGNVVIQKCPGKVEDLKQLTLKNPIKAKMGMGHTRWATHGKPSEINSHPHADCSGKIVVIHNGIIENYDSLRKDLKIKNHKFESETDTEVIAHLIETYYKDNLLEAVLKALGDVTGSYAIAVIHQDNPDQMVLAKKSSPLAIGLGKDENYFASDVLPFIGHTNRVIYLEDGEVSVVTKKTVEVFSLQGKPLKKEIKVIEWTGETVEKGIYPHFMLKEIHEQPKAILDTIQGRITRDSNEIFFDRIKLTKEDILNFNRIVFVGCGTSWHAGLIGEYLMEELVKLPVKAEYAAEFRYRNPVIDEKTLVIAITQSGETADTLAAVEEALRKRSKVVAICNVVDSSIARMASGVIYTFAGPEIGVASTKAFTTQLTVLYLLAIYLGRVRGTFSDELSKTYIENLRALPIKLQEVLNEKLEREIKRIAKKYANKKNFIYLGRGVGYPIALEGALKLKEISYIHAEGYPAAEMKHGPIALIDENMPTIVLAFKGRRYEKVMGNIMEVKARKGIVIAIATEGNEDIKDKVDEVIYIPNMSEFLSPILAVIPLQMLAYYIAVEKGCTIDQPRNLAKSVTVE